MHFFMRVLDFLYSLIDFPFRLWFYFLGKYGKYSVFSNSDLSDSDSTPYSKYVKKVIQNEYAYLTFRRGYSYRLILEHVDYNLGLNYFHRLNNESIAQYCNNVNLKRLSKIGTPRKFYYPQLGWVSPTIIRYLFVNQHLNQLFGKLTDKTVGEIGVGFGGQCAVTSTIESIDKYSAYDIPEVLILAEKTLASCGVELTVFEKKGIDPVVQSSYDLVVSNYAFSELPAHIQLDYVQKVFTRSERGYLTMNSGRTNHSGRSEGKMSLEEICSLIPGSEVIDEEPLTGPDNYLIVWGHK